VPPAPTASPPSTRASRREAQRASTSDREIESWLGELSGKNGTPSQHAQPVDEPTTAIPTQRPRKQEPTEKIAAHEAPDEEPKRRGGGVSAADLLRREGRL
jgi:RND superfamily putative drug exporter